MIYHPITSFRRAADAVPRELVVPKDHAGQSAAADKWDILRTLSSARTALGLSDRTLTVLQALLTFHPERVLDADKGTDLVVFPSNASICERLNGMPCSTMRRHISKLVKAGLIIRRDSPNGKRFVRRYGSERDAYGFDLAPLPRRYGELQDLAEAIRVEQQCYDRVRRALSLMLRDLKALVEIGSHDHPAPLWDRLGDCTLLAARSLRRTMSADEMAVLQQDLCSAIADARDALGCPASTELSTKDAQNEHHIHNSNLKNIELESAPENHQPTKPSDTNRPLEPYRTSSDLPLKIILDRCKEVQTYATEPITDWRGFHTAVEAIRPMMGISTSLWHSVRSRMGPQTATITLAAILERFGHIRNPGGYLLKLCSKFEAQEFSYVPMISALNNLSSA